MGRIGYLHRPRVHEEEEARVSGRGPHVMAVGDVGLPESLVCDQE